MNSLTCQYAPSMHAANRHDRALPCCKQSSFLSGQAVRCSAASSISARPGRRPLQVVSFKFLKSMGLKKPSFLPDFGQVCISPALCLTLLWRPYQCNMFTACFVHVQAKRQTLLTQLFSTTDRQTLESLIAEGATIQEGGKGSQKYSRTGGLLQTVFLIQACAACCSLFSVLRPGEGEPFEVLLGYLAATSSVLHLEGLLALQADDCLLPRPRSPEQSKEVSTTAGCLWVVPELMQC